MSLRRGIHLLIPRSKCSSACCSGSTLLRRRPIRSRASRLRTTIPLFLVCVRFLGLLILVYVCVCVSVWYVCMFVCFLNTCLYIHTLYIYVCVCMRTFYIYIHTCTHMRTYKNLPAHLLHREQDRLLAQGRFVCLYIHMIYVCTPTHAYIYIHNKYKKIQKPARASSSREIRQTLDTRS